MEESEKFYQEFHDYAKYGDMKKWYLGYYKERYMLVSYMVSGIPWESCADRLVERVCELGKCG